MDRSTQNRRGLEVAFFQEAVAFAARAHRHQVRKDGRTPYMSHVVRVTMTVQLVFDCDDAVAILAALLHDTIEDTTTDYDDLLERFGAEVADVVAALTKNMALPEAAREAEYDRRLASAPWQARLVKLADTYDNLCDVESYPPEQRGAKRCETLDRCARALALVRDERGSTPPLDRGARALEELLGRSPGVA